MPMTRKQADQHEPGAIRRRQAGHRTGEPRRDRDRKRRRQDVAEDRCQAAQQPGLEAHHNGNQGHRIDDEIERIHRRIDAAEAPEALPYSRSINSPS
jgi:hypothetical protein